MKEFVNRMIKNEEGESWVRGLDQLQKRRQCLAKSDKHFGAMAFCKQNAVEFCEANYLHQQKNEMLMHLALLLCKGSFVNTMNTKMSITVHNDGRLVFTFRNGSEETVMM